MIPAKQVLCQSCFPRPVLEDQEQAHRAYQHHRTAEPADRLSQPKEEPVPKIGRRLCGGIGLDTVHQQQRAEQQKENQVAYEPEDTVARWGKLHQNQTGKEGDDVKNWIKNERHGTISLVATCPDSEFSDFRLAGFACFSVLRLSKMNGLCPESSVSNGAVVDDICLIRQQESNDGYSHWIFTAFATASSISPFCPTALSCSVAKSSRRKAIPTRGQRLWFGWRVPDNTAAAQSNIPLIVAGNEMIIVDVGAGNRFQPSEGRLEANLDAIGVKAHDVTTVIISHAHPDHMWGITRDDGTLRFANARYYIGRYGMGILDGGNGRCPA